MPPHPVRATGRSHATCCSWWVPRAGRADLWAALPGWQLHPALCRAISNLGEALSDKTWVMCTNALLSWGQYNRWCAHCLS